MNQAMEVSFSATERIQELEHCQLGTRPASGCGDQVSARHGNLFSLPAPGPAVCFSKADQDRAVNALDQILSEAIKIDVADNFEKHRDDVLPELVGIGI